MDKLLPPTLDEVEAFLRDLPDPKNPRGHEWYREPELPGVDSWQRDAMRHVAEHSHAILQGPRQWFGKTWLTSRYGACCLARGLNVLVSYPVQSSAEQLMIDRIDRAMVMLEDKGIVRRKRPDNVRFKKWDTAYGEVQLKVLSLSEGAKSGTQGFTTDVWICDEAQECLMPTYEAVEPSADIADKEGRAKIILLGVGGNSTEHLIEAKKPIEEKTWRDAGEPIDEDEAETPFIARRFTTEHIIAASPSYGPWYAKKQRNMTAPAWRQNYECLPCLEGTGYIFPVLEAKVYSDVKETWMEFGIDVGRVSNCTCVHAIECSWGHANVIETLRLYGQDFQEQAANIAAWIDKYLFLPVNVRYEQNTIGYGLSDVLTKIYPFYNITPVQTNDAPPEFEKSRWILWLQHEATQGRLGIQDAKLRQQLRRLMFEVKMQPTSQLKYEWPHSDELSALAVWASGKVASVCAA